MEADDSIGQQLRTQTLGQLFTRAFVIGQIFVKATLLPGRTKPRVWRHSNFASRLERDRLRTPFNPDAELFFELTRDRRTGLQ